MKRILLIFLFSFITSASAERVILENRYEVDGCFETRIYEDIILDCGENREARFTVSLPLNIPKEGLPCIFIVGGLMTGRESLRFIPNHGNYALVSYEYPEVLKKIREISFLWNIFSVRKGMLDVCPQLLAIVKYLQKQSWSNHKSISLMGYSFGALFIPVTYVKAEEEGLDLGPAVMAYGGAGMYCILDANVPVPDFLKRPVASLGAVLFKPMDPLIYAPKMKGNPLIINGIYDKQVPLNCAMNLQNIVPDPKTIINIESDHMSPDNEELTLKLIRITRLWLDQKLQ